MLTNQRRKESTGVIMKIQVVRFRRNVPMSNKVSNWELGVAKMNAGFGTSDVDWIVDVYGLRVEDLYDYKLMEGPLKYIDTENI